jgi:ribonuclease HII
MTKKTRFLRPSFLFLTSHFYPNPIFHDKIDLKFETKNTKSFCHIMKKGSISKNYFKHEQNYARRGFDFVIGVDEAGRGPLAGPVVAVAATIRNFQFQVSNDKNFHKKIKLIRDSKLMTEKQREGLYDFILENFHVGIGTCDHKTIDRINILNATYLAMKIAITNLSSKLNDQELKSRLKNKKEQIVLVDGNKRIPNLSIDQKAIIGGDRLVKSISAASVVAKVTRDRVMHQMDKKYPLYGFSKHKGYGTKMHREMIKKHGFCEIHRRSFKVK